MGIGSIMKSKEIVLMAFGESKADAIKGMIEGPVTNHLPASVLQNHDNVVGSSMKKQQVNCNLQKRLGQKRLTPEEIRNSRKLLFKFL